MSVFIFRQISLQQAGLGGYTFSAPANPAPHPHARVQMQVPRITGFHVHVQAE